GGHSARLHLQGCYGRFRKGSDRSNPESIPKPDQGYAGSGPQPQDLLSQTQKTWNIMKPRKLGELLYKKGNTRLGCCSKYTPGCSFVGLPPAWRRPVSGKKTCLPFLSPAPLTSRP